MAVAALSVNTFKTVTAVVGTSTVGIYTAPVGYTGVFLLAQCSNIGSTTQNVSFYHNRNVSGVGTVTTEIVKNFDIPGNDTANLLPGKLVLETNDYVTISGSSSSGLKFIISILETSNQ
jgi:hypothetical protein